MAIVGLRVERLVESTAVELDLTDDQGEGLRALGRKMASDKPWWGATEADSEADVRTAIKCDPLKGARWSVRVDNAVGSVSVGGLQLIVQPKIPTAHLLHFFTRSGEWPTFDESLAPLAMDHTMLDLVIRWYLNATERLLRGDLMRDYQDDRDDLAAVRGRVDCMGTANLFFAGRLAVTCEFEEFDVDTALNRVLKAAVRMIAGDASMGIEHRRRAERIAERMDGVGDMTQADFHASVDRRTSSYRDAIVLARHVLKSQGRALGRGDVSARAFLISTPKLVEAAIRAILSDGLQGACTVTSGRRQLVGSTLTINPDLVFGPPAVGDVKYKVNWSTWPRSDLYQAVAFAAGFRRRESLVVSFCGDDREKLSAAYFGDVRVSHLQWHAVVGALPEMAEAAFVRDAQDWWGEIATHVGAEPAGLGGITATIVRTPMTQRVAS